PVFSGRLASKAASPAGCMRPCATSAWTLRTLTRLQIEPVRRGVKRIWYDASSMRLRTPSIQPKQSASSTDSDQDMFGLPVATLRKPTTSSEAEAWCACSQIRKACAESKKTGGMRTLEPGRVQGIPAHREVEGGRDSDLASGRLPEAGQAWRRTPVWPASPRQVRAIPIAARRLARPLRQLLAQAFRRGGIAAFVQQ